MSSPQYWAVIPAAGVGKRMQATSADSLPKQYLQIQGKTILEHTINRLERIPGLTGMVLVLNEQDTRFAQLDLHPLVPLTTAVGGDERARSVLNGLAAIADRAAPQDWVLVHDVVRPCVSAGDIDKLCRQLAQDPVGGLLATPVRETLKKGTAGGGVECTVPREDYWLAATPQMFRYGLLKQALEQALQANTVVTDEAYAMERAGHSVRLVAGRADNIKITHVEDLFLAEHILGRQEAP